MLRLPSTAIFRHRPYLLFWVGRVTSVLAMQVQLTAMGWQIYYTAREHGRSVEEASLLLGAMGLAQFLPLLVLSLFGGQAADRYNRKAILLGCLFGKAAIAAGLLYATNLPNVYVLPALFASAAVTGAINAFLPAANSSLLPILVPRQELPMAIAWGSLGFQFAIIAGPSLGGALLTFGNASAYGATFVLLLAAVLMLLATKTPPQQRVEDARTLGMIREGLQFVRDNKIVLGAISLDLIVVLLAGAVALLPAFARDILHAGPREFGLLRTSMGMGAAVVALGLAIAPLRRRVGLWMFCATIVFGLATIVFGFSTSIWVSIGALAIAGGVDMISVYVRQSLIQLATPDAMRGRVSAVSFVFISASNEFGDFEAGVMARLMGPVIAVAVGGAGAVAASLAWIKLFPQLWTADGFEAKDTIETITADPQQTAAE
jgi:MFS family permease